MRKFVIAMGLATLTSGCGSFNLNEILVTKAQQEAIDSIVQEAQYEYDKGRYDKALGLTNKALAINPNSESPTILKAYVFLSKSGLDAIGISKKLITATEAESTSTTTSKSASTPAKTGDTTTDNFNVLKSILNLSATDFAEIGTADTIGVSPNEQEVYYPKTASIARAGNSPTINYLNDAVETLCPLILPNANPPGDTDSRHSCPQNLSASASKGRANFAWALAHLGEAISFYTVVLYDSNGDGIPNLQEAIPATQISATNAASFISTVQSVNVAINAIFPTEAVAAADSMLNALFSDLKTTSTALAAIPGVPGEVSTSIQKSITDLETKIAAISTSTSSQGAAGSQNEALKNSLTTGLASTLEAKIESSQFETLSTENQTKACCVYRNMNSSASAPSTCSEADYNDVDCAAALAE